ncbi:YadA-like family protein [Pusillimonas sp. ANT_WB101]|uniref:YadA-like family protein n=1 Tax=Pusillimonas sp. ANT_WB101 TaxID=2597356 RepID=UPI0011EC39BA|nr:YadA-like family protein [Pusillimonas sp. ANT_WB101]KAA0890599.1 hypothetical protein FQ179_13005 [Pusillimonas sp. ANT_WB101]
MNRIYRTLWNEQTGTYVAVPEIAKSRGKRSGSSVGTGARGAAPAGAWTLTLCALALMGAGLLGSGQVAFAQALTGSSLAVTGDADVGGDLTVDGKSTLEDDLDVKKKLTVAGATSLQSVTAQNLGVTGATTLAGTLSVAGQSTLGALTAGTTTLSGLTVTGGTTQLAGLNVTGATTLAGLTVNGSSALGAVTANTVTSMGATTVGGPLSVTGQTTLNGGLDVAGNQITNVGNGNVAAGSTDAINAGQVYHLLNEEGKGIKYFRANSTKPDAHATGVDSIAIGPDSVSGGTSSFAAGHNARTGANNAVAVGADSDASATGALAAGTGAKASGGNAAAIGAGAIAEGASSVAVGDGAKALTPTSGSDPVAAIAIGKDSVSSGAGSTAIGHQASASGGNTLAFGTSATASGANGIAMGKGAVAAAENNISIGSAAGLSTNPNLPNDRSHNIAIGAQSGQHVDGQFNVAMGDQAGNGVEGNENIAFGRKAGVGVDGDANVSIGTNANTGRTANRAVSIGEDSKSETEGVAIGYLASAGNTGVALGRQTTALGTGTAVGPNAHADSGYVALGLNSRASQADVSGSSKFTNRPFSGSAVSVGSSAAGGEFTRRIVNVEDGANETDAVNVRQLQQAVSGIDLSDIDFAGGVINNLQTQIDQNMQQYVSINDGGTDKGNKNNNGAVATDSIAIGPDATTKNRDAIAIGHMAGAEGDSAVVLGHNIKGLGKNSTTVGNSQSEARHESGVAIGTHVISRDENSIVIGRDSYTDRQDNGPSVKNSIVIGTQSSSTAVEGIVIGKDSVVNADRGIAQGSAAHATAANAMAFGTGARGAGVDSQASGTGAGSYAERGIALGAKARSGQENPNVGDLGSNRDSIAIGSDSVAEMNSSIATGREARATANFAQALGYKAQASGVESIAQGSSALALGQQAIAMGTGAQSTAASAMAMGTGAQSTAADAVAMGAGAHSTAAGAVAIGRGATAENGRSVALGDGAATDGPVGTTNATLNNLTYGNFAGTAPIATVSVGTAGEKRTITNVAAGRISGTSTDAINGSQLYATNSVLGNVANTTKGILGGNAKLTPNGSLTMTNIGNTGEDNVHDAIQYAAQGWNLSTNSGVASTVAPGGDVDLANTDGNIKIAQAGGNVQFNLADDVKVKNDLTVGGDTAITGNTTIAGMTKLNGGATISNSLSVNPNTNVNFGGNKITNVAAGTADTDAVNVSQLNTVKNTPITFAGNAGSVDRKLGETQIIRGSLANTAAASSDNIRTQVNAAGDMEILLAKNLTADSLSINNGGPVINNTGINMGGKKITNLAKGTDGTDAVNVDQLTEVSDVANKGWDLSTNNGVASNVAPGGKVDLANTDGNIKIAQAGGNVQFNLADDVKVKNDLTVGGDTTIAGMTNMNGGATISNSLTVNPNTNVNFGGNKITNVAAGTADTDGVNVSQLNTLANKPLTFKADAGADLERRLGDSVAINGADSNISTTTTPEGVDIALAKDLKLGPAGSVTMGNTLVNNAGLTITGGPSVTVGGIHAGDKKITNVTAGTAPTDAVNVSQLTDQDTALTTKGLDFSGNTGADVHRDLGTKLAIKGDATTASTYSGANLKTVTDPANGAINIQMAEAPEFKAVTTNDLTVNNNLSVKNGATINMGGNKITNVAAGTDKTDAVNVGQLDNVSDVANAGWNVSSNSGTTTNNIGPNGKVDFRGDSNVTIAQTGADDDAALQVKLNPDLAVTSVTTGNTVMNTGGITVNGGANGPITLTNDGLKAGTVVVSAATGINAGDKKITNVTAGVADTDAVNVSQLKNQDTALTTKGLDFAGNTGVDVHRDLGTTLAIKGDATTADTYSGANLKTVTDPANGAINIQMAEAPEFKAVTTNDLTVNNNLSVKNGATINMGHNKITNVAAGTDKTDAVNLGQLDDVSDVANAGWHLTANGASSTNVKPTETVDLTNATDNNIVVSKGTETNPHQVRFGLADNVTIANNLKVGGNSEVAGNATIGGNTSIGGSASIAGAMSVAGASHLAGGATISEKLIVSPNTDINMGGNKVHGVAAGTADTDGVNVSQLNTLANKPLTFKADAGADLDRKLGETVAIKGADSNISTATTPDGVNIALAKNLNLGPTGSVQMGNTLVDNNGLTIAGGPSVTLTGGVNAGGKVISNVAPGVAGTDGVNVNQLKDVDATANKGWHLTATGANSSNVKPDGKVDLSPTDGNIVITKVATDNDIKFALADDLNLGTVNVNKNLTVKGDTNLGDTFYVTPGAINVAPATTINMGGNKITNVAKAENNGEVVVYEQLGELDDTLTKKGMNFSGNRGADVHRDLGTTLAIKGVASTAGAYTGANIRTVTDPASGAINILMAKAPVFDAVTTEDLTVNQNLTVKKGAKIDMGGNKITNVKAGTNKLDAVNFGQLKKVDETANKGWHLTATGANSSNVKPDGKVDLSPTDGNIVITKVATDNDIKFALADDLNLGTVNVNKNLTVKGDTNLGDTFYVTPGAINVAPATTINMGGNKITNVAKAENNGEVVVYEQLGELDDTLTKKGMNFAGNKGADVHRDLGTTLAIKGVASTAGGYSGANIKTVTDPATGAINIRMAKAPVFDAVTTEGLTVNQNLTVKNGATINMGGNKVTNVAAGTDKTDAVNLGQLDDVSDVANAGWHLTANGADSTNVKPSDKVDLTNATDNNIVVSKGPATDPHQVRFGLADNVTIANNLTVTNNANVGGALNVTGLASLSGGAHISKELIVSPNTDINMGGNKVHGVDAGTADTDAVNVSQLNTLANKPLTFKADAGADLNRKLGETVAITGADSNISTTTNPDGLSIALSKNLDLGVAGSVQMGDTLINGTGLTLLGGPSITLAGINAGNKVITNVAPGVAGTDAVNVNQLTKVDETANKGWHVSASGANSSNVKPDGKVDLLSTDGNMVIEKLATDHDIKFALADSLELGTVNISKNLTVKGDTNLGDTFYVTPGAINVAGGTTINMGGNKITNVAKAENNGDVVVYEQLGELDDAVTTKGLNFAGNEGADVHRDLGSTLAIQGEATTAGAYSGANLKTVTDPVTGAINIQMAEAPEFKAVVTNDLTVNKSLMIKHGATINMGGNKVTNVAAGTDKTDAVNVGQLDDVSEVANRGWNLKADGKNESNVAPGGTVDLANTDKNIVIEKDATDPNKVLFNLAREISIDQVTTGNTVMNTEGITIAGGPNGPISLTNQGLTAGSVIISSISGINAGGHKITNVAAGTALTDAVNVSQLKDVQQNVDNLGDRAVKYDGKAGDPKNQITLEGTKSMDGGKTGGTTISNLAQGEVSKNSTEAINGSQLHDMGEQVAGSLGGNSKFVGGKLVTELNVGGNSYNNVNDALVGLNTDLENVSNVANAGWNVQTNGGDASKVAPGKTVNFKDGQNIKITNDGLNIIVSTADDITVKSVTATKVTAEEVAIKDGPTINKGGIDMHDKRITNLAAGVDDQDAVNVSQLNKATGDLNSRVDNLSGKVNQVDNRASAGIAAALATAGLPQAYLPGKSMFSVAGGTWRGETGYAMGLSTVSDNGKWVVKGSATSSSRGDYGGSVGVGYQW